MYKCFIPTLVAAYLVGAIPFGVLIARLHHIDLRQVGSGNIGATNVARTLGRPWGVCCFFLDTLKGLVPMLFVLIWVKSKILNAGYSGQVFNLLWLAVGLSAILGHVFPVYLGFRGGKGVATSFGVALGLWPYFTGSAIVAFIIWIVVLFRWKYVSLASIVATMAFPVALLLGIVLVSQWTLTDLWPLALISLAIPGMVLVRHRSNITRLHTGTEPRIGQTAENKSAR